MFGKVEALPERRGGDATVQDLSTSNRHLRSKLLFEAAPVQTTSSGLRYTYGRDPVVMHVFRWTKRDHVTTIRALNDRFRQSSRGGMLVITAGVIALGQERQLKILEAVARFDQFDQDNDPYGEHDLGR